MKAVRGLPADLAASVTAALSERGALPLPTCNGCALGKSHRAPIHAHRPAEGKATSILQCVHLDLKGPVTVRAQNTEQQEVRASLDGGTGVYLSVLVDEYSRRVWGALLHTKGDAAAHIKDWTARVEKQTGHVVKEFHSDGGKEYLSLAPFCRERGIVHSITQPYTPQHNGIAERMNRTLFEMAIAMMSHARLPPAFWEEAILTAIFLHNRCLTKGNEAAGASGPTQTPEQILSGAQPSVKHVVVFGSDGFLHVPKVHRGSALDERAHHCIMIGYAANGGWRVLDLETGKIVSSRDVTFNENEFTFRGIELAKALGTDAVYNEVEDQQIDEVLARMSYREMLATAIENSLAGATTASQPAADAAVSSSSAAPTSKPRRGARFVLGGVPVVAASGGATPDVDVDVPHTPPVAIASEAPTFVDAPAASISSSAPVGMKLNQRPTRERKQVVLPNIGHAHAVFEPPSSLAPEPDPVDYASAMSSASAVEWQAACDAEMASHARNGTWVVVELPPHRRPIGNKWVFKTKYRADGSLDKRKARLVAKGFTQQYGVDFLNTWSPAVKYKTLRIVLALATRWDLELDQLDVETAFLNAKMKEEVHMEMPEGYAQRIMHEAMASGAFKAAAGASLVCRLVMCLYGTKQASMEWNAEVNHTIVFVLGFTRTVCDPCLYFKVSATGLLLLLCLFVDDIVTAYHRRDKAEWDKLKRLFMEKYRCKDAGVCFSLLGMRIERDRTKRILRIDQTVYVCALLAQFGMSECKPAPTPAQAGVILSTADTASPLLEYADRKQYESAIGTILYAAMSTVPEVAFAVNQLARFLAAPREVHWHALKRVIRYMQSAKDIALVFDCSEAAGMQLANAHAEKKDRANPAAVSFHPPECVRVSAYCDADWAGCPDTRCSTSGYVVRIFECAVSWMSKKQKAVARSSTDAEYVALSAVMQELQWMHQLLKEVGLRPHGRGVADAHEHDAPPAEADVDACMSESESTRTDGAPCACLTCVYSDNQSALTQCRGESDYHARSKHIDIAHHFTKAAVRRGEVALQWVESANQFADVFTKPLDASTFVRLRDVMRGPRAGTEGQAKKEGGVHVDAASTSSHAAVCVSSSSSVVAARQ